MWSRDAQLMVFVIAWEWLLAGYYGALLWAPARWFYRRPALRGYAVSHVTCD